MEYECGLFFRKDVIEMELENKMSLPEKLLTLRKKSGLTQSEVAEKLHVSRQAISRWEVGSTIPSADKMKLMSKLYGVPVDWLLHDDLEFADMDNTKQMLPVQKQIGKCEGRGRLFLCIAGAVLSLLLILCMVLAIYLDDVPDSGEGGGEAVPIENMTVAGDNYENNYATFSFSVE